MPFKYLVVDVFEKPPPIRFNYSDGTISTTFDKLEDFLNFEGNRGWELTAAFPIFWNVSPQKNRQAVVTRMIFKKLNPQ